MEAEGWRGWIGRGMLKRGVVFFVSCCFTECSVLTVALIAYLLCLFKCSFGL
jgi:hypothetical protein